MARIFGAVAIAVFVTLVAFSVLSSYGAAVVSNLVASTESWAPKASPSTNTGEWGPLLLYPVCLSAGVVCGALFYDPDTTIKYEAYITIAAFIILISVSGTNYWLRDALISVNAQALIDLALCVTGLSLMILLVRWKPKFAISLAVQRLSLFLVTVFGFTLPLFYVTKLWLGKLGFGVELKGISDFIGLISAAVGFAAAVAPNFLTKETARTQTRPFQRKRPTDRQ